MAAHKWHRFLPFLWLLSLCYYAYFIEDRAEVYSLLAVVSLTMFSAFIAAFRAGGKDWKYWNICFAAAGVLLLFQMPLLSDDYYRFAWDGYLFYKGVNVYVFTPEKLLEFYSDPFLQSLFPLLNSGGYYSIYTPVNQWIYALPFVFEATTLFEFVVGLRLLFVLFGCLGFWALQKTLPKLGYDKKWALVVLAHPLLWLEGFANLHIEWLLLMGLFSVLAIAVFFRTSLAIVVTPMVLAVKMSTFPYLILLFSLVRNRRYYVYLAIGASVALWLSVKGFGSFNGIENALESLALFSKTFEFNGLLYEGVNGWISSLLGYNAIVFVGPVLNAIALLLVATISFRMFFASDWKRKVQGFQWICLVFLLCASTVHPWYLLIPLSTLCFVFNPFLALWSGTVFLSYFYYQDYRIGPWILLEYGLPFLLLLHLGSRVKIEQGVS